MKNVYKFSCRCIELRKQGNDAFYRYKFTTNDKLPHLDVLSSMFEKETLYSGYLKADIMLMLHTPYHIKGFLESNRSNDRMYYTYIAESIVCPLSDDVMKFKLLSEVAGSYRATIILQHCADFINMVVNDEPIDLKKIPGVKDKSFKLIQAKLKDRYPIQELSTWLTPYNVKIHQIQKLLELEKNPHILRHKIEANPYILSGMKGSRFDVTDKLALKINPAMKSSLQRLQAFVEWYLHWYANEHGDTMIKEEELLQEIHNVVPECEEQYINLKIQEL